MMVPCDKPLMIRLRTLGDDKIEEITLQEAERILETVYNDPMGGFVVDAKERKVIWQIDNTIEEIMVMDILGGG